MTEPAQPTAALLTLGCARNDVDSEELAARLVADGWRVLAGDGAASAGADVVVVNTCGFVTEAKRESIDTVLDHAGSGQRVVAVGCLAERYGRHLADELPEADAVLGFDAYPDLGTKLRRVLAGEHLAAHEPLDRRTLLPITPIERHHHSRTAVPGHGPGAEPTGVVLPPVLRTRLASGPVAPLKIASGCDRRCAFCAIPRFRGAFVSRPPDDVLAEARWLAEQGVREVVLVSENSTSYGKDFGHPGALESLLPELANVPDLERIRVSYLQPAELRPGLVETIAATEKVADYFDLSFQHASGPLLRRMRRFGDAGSFLDLIATIRRLAPDAGIRSNVIVGFPGETDRDVVTLERFLAEAELDAVGVFGYSDEDGTEAAGLPDQVDPDEILERVDRVSSLVEVVSAARAADRKDQVAAVLVESHDADARGRCAFQGPEDGETRVLGDVALPPVGDFVAVRIVGSDGVDLMGEPLAVSR